MSRKILVVDDEASVRRMLSRFLTGRGYHVLEASDGLEALESYRGERPHLVLLDVEMPRQDGIWALREIKALDPDAFVVMVTAGLREEAWQEALDLGAADYILKPITAEKLESLLGGM